MISTLPFLLVSLLDMNYEKHPEMIPFAQELESIGQLMEVPEHEGDWRPGENGSAAAPLDEGGPRVRALCTVSFLDSSRIVTAEHCLRAKSGHIESNHFVRRHLY